MSSFTTPLDLRYSEEGQFLVLDPFIYELGGLGTGATIVVPAGFKTDFASIPRPLRWLLSPTDPHYARAAVLHDWLYQQGISRALADAVFMEAMEVLGCPSSKRHAVYFGVRMGGWLAWHRYHVTAAKVQIDMQQVFEDTVEDIDDIEQTLVLDRDELPSE